MPVLDATQLCLLFAGIFFLVGLLTGVWKYRQIETSANARATRYVDIAHRSSLLYAFAAILLKEFVPFSPLSETGTLLAVAIPLFFFAAAIASYILHGALNDTTNQLAKPHRLGRFTLPVAAMKLFMWALIAGEVGGFAVLFYGFLKTVF